MLNKLKLVSLMTVAALGLQACGDDDPRTADAPTQLINVNSTVYSQLRAGSADVDTLFNTFGATDNSGLCDVKVHRIKYNTVGGAGEAATSSGVFMLPHGESEQCGGARPVLLYAHGTNTYKSYDLSQFIPAPDSTPNPASTEGMLLLAAYASKGYAVIAPNYAGYSDSSLDYHPYLDETQQSTEMMNALDHVREYAGMLGANLSPELFVTGLSQGGYVAMATHKALEASGEKVAASMPVSGPYAMLDFIDTVFAGYVSGGATVFAPMAFTALDRSVDIYDDPSEVYAAAYAGTADNSLPTVGGFAAASLPPSALFSGTAPADAPNQAGFGDNHLLADSLRMAYLTDLQTNGANPEYKLRKAVKDLDLRNWTPAAPTFMCGANNDPVVYFSNTAKMAEHWSALAGTPLLSILDLNATPDGPFAQVQGGFQAQNFSIDAVHGNTGIFCALAGKGYFDGVRAQIAAAAAAASN